VAFPADTSVGAAGRAEASRVGPGGADFSAMSLPQRLTTALAGRYELVRELGAGGMATVYLSRDLKHERDVAIKVLHPDLGAALGAERFLAEIKTTAQLQHPHILPLLDSGAADGLLYYVMPYVRGETLRSRLERERQLPVADAVRLAREVASALDSAHRQGVIHRDIKPENILLHDGSALVADFGIALAVQQAGGARMTQTGLSLGTPQYMAPEQAMGEKQIDARADVYALGAVVYELLTGDPPFTGSTVQAIVAKVLTERPMAPTAVRDTVPAHVEGAVLQALAKVPADRPSSAREFADLLAGAHATSNAGILSHGMPPALARGGRRHIWSVLPWFVAASTLVFALTRAAPVGARDDTSPVVRLPVPLPANARVPASVEGALAISPAGDLLAYVVEDSAGSRVMLRRTSDLTARMLVDHGVRSLLFSRDGQQLYYRDGLELWRIAISGGNAERIATLPASRLTNGITWGRGDTLLIGSTQGLFALAVQTGAERRVTEAADRFAVRYPLLLPDKRTVVFSRTDSLLGPRGTLSLLSLDDGGRTTPLPFVGYTAVAVVGSHLLVTEREGGTLRALPADADALRRGGKDVVVADSVIGTVNDGPQFVVSASGSLLQLRGALLTPRVSPDGARVLVRSMETGRLTVYTRASRSTVLLADSVVRADWTADGTRVAYRLIRRVEFFQRAADGRGEPEPIMDVIDAAEVRLSPDGRWVLYRTPSARANPSDIMAVSLDRPGPPLPMAVGPTSEQGPELSSDMRWLAYLSNASGRFEVYLRPFPGDGARTVVSRAGGFAPFWSARGRTLYYRNATQLLAVDVGADGALTPARRVVADLAELGVVLGLQNERNYDLSANEREFVFARRQPGAERLVFVHNWARELRERVGGAAR
jgi:hypothetical protein